MTVPVRKPFPTRQLLALREELRGILAAILGLLGRFYVRHANAIGAVAIAGLVVAVMLLGWLRPVHAWDMLAYLGAAWSDRFPDAAALHSHVYEAVRHAVSPSEYAALAEGDTYRLRQSTDPLAFQSMLGMYAIKWLYVKLLGIAASFIGAANAGYAINVASAAGFTGVLVWWLRAAGMLNLGPAVVALLLVSGFPALAMAETPDLMASALMLAAFLLLDRGMGVAGIVALVLGVATRPDEAAAAGVLMAFFWLMRDGLTSALGAGFLASFAAYVLATHGSGHPGWWPHLWFSTYQIQDSMEFFNPPLSLKVYVTAFSWNLARAAFENTWLGLYLAGLILWAVLHAGGLKFPDRRIALIGGALTAIAAKFVLFPLHDGRTVFPLLFPALILLLASARDAARGKATA